MNISGISNNPYFSSVQYRVAELYDNNEQLNSRQDDEQRPAKPPHGRGPKGLRGAQKGPNLDTDGDGSWSASEVEEYASYSSILGIELNAAEIMSTYDTDEDGQINSEERRALGRDNAFKLPSPQEVMKSMVSQNPNFAISDEQKTTESTNNTNYYILKQLLAAYNQTSKESLYDLMSTVSYEV